LTALILGLALLAYGCSCGDDDDNDDHDHSADDDSSGDDDASPPACGFGFDLLCWGLTFGGECLDSYPEDDMDDCEDHCKKYDDSLPTVASAENEDTGEVYGSYCVCCSTPLW
jgi:hypothetical protein